MADSLHHFGIVGAGAWGTAIALALLRDDCAATIWSHETDVTASINNNRENKTYLPGVQLHAGLKATTELADIIKCDALILATPAQHTRAVVKRIAALNPRSLPVIIAAKGIEQGTSLLMSDVVYAELPSASIAVLSGPSFAIEVAKGMPAALTLAAEDRELGEALLRAMAAPTFRLYLTDDVIGSQVGGAVKNVLAVACGIIAGRNMGENARAALITRGLAEIMRLSVALGGREDTLMGLSGLGDIVLTCSSAQSRNMSLGMELGQGKALTDILAVRSSVAEGVTTASAALELAKKHGVDMPVVDAVDAVLNRKADIDDVIAGLLARPLKPEGA